MSRLLPLTLACVAALPLVHPQPPGSPADEAPKDGDVIVSIDGREPTSVRHALRILSSYQPGEALELNILRDKKKRTLNIEVPDNRQGMNWVPAPAPRPVAAPKPRPAPRPMSERT